MPVKVVDDCSAPHAPPLTLILYSPLVIEFSVTEVPFAAMLLIVDAAGVAALPRLTSNVMYLVSVTPSEVAVKVTVYGLLTTLAFGVPEISRVDVLNDSPFGNPEAV